LQNTIPCPVLRKIAEELDVPYKEAGEAANEMKIKIKNCDLGCF
jgi:LAO/AO transport system kinase